MNEVRVEFTLNGESVAIEAPILDVGAVEAEAAARLDISEGALKVRVHRAIGRMRRMLEAERV